MSLFFAREQKAIPPFILALNFLIAVAVLSAIFYYAFSQSLSAWQGDVLVTYRAQFWSGWKLTVVVSALSLILSTVMGFLWAIAGRSAFLPLRALAKVCVELIRGTPLLAQIFIFFTS